MVNVDAAILLTRLDDESAEAAIKQDDPFLLRFANGDVPTVAELRIYLKSTTADMAAAVTVLKAENHLLQCIIKGGLDDDNSTTA